jgi:predicted NBD/HSP70 family sugar kinase
MSQMAMMAASLAMSGIQTMAQNSAMREQQKHYDETARLQVEELRRQQKRDDQIAAEEKSDIAREFALELGSLIAAAADGGVTTAGLARAGGAAGAVAGLDKARIESNRQEGQSRRRADSLAIITENAAQRKQTKSNIFNNTLGFFGNAAGTLMQSDFAFNATPTTTPSMTKGSTGIMPGEWQQRKVTKRPFSRALLS